MLSKHSQAGFSYIEVLLAMSLFLMLMVSMIDFEILAIWESRAALQQTIVIGELSNAEAIEKTDPAQFSNWLSELKNKIPAAKARIIDHHIDITWYSPVSSIWRCDQPRRQNESCLSELTI